MSLRRLGWFVLGVFLVLGIGAGAVLQRLRRGPGLPGSAVDLPGLSAPAEVLWDSLAIPQVYAASVEDAFRVQGWLHGRDRLWQAEMFRRVSHGTLSELFGEATLASDRFLRTLDLGGAAERTADALDPETRRLVQAYVDGLNAAVDGWSGPLPPEFVVLRAEAGHFTVRDALALEMIMAWDLAAYELTLDLTEAFRELGPEGFEAVRPYQPSDGVTILGDAYSAAGSEAAGSRSPSAVAAVVPSAALAAAARVPRVAAALLDAGSMVRASNAWVVGPERSRSGKPLLANDMHLTLRQPTLFYLVGLHAPGMDVVGMSLPGTPGVVAGHTGGVAWGYTNAYVDDTDLFVERVDPADTTRYLTPTGSAPFRRRVDVIPVRGGSPDTMVVRETRHGPVITPVESRAGGELLALRWIALDASTSPAGIIRMNRSSTVAQLLEGVALFSDPHQNVVFADTAGAWGYWMAGRVPRRPDTLPPLLPVAGWTGAHDWQGYLPFEEHPHALEPAAGFVATANNRQSRAPASDRISNGAWAAPWRAQRITELLEARRDHDAASMIAIQLDVESVWVRRHRGAAVEVFRAAGLDGEADALERWDGRATLDSHAATAFYLWMVSLRRLRARALYGRDGGYFPWDALERELVRGQVPVEDAVAAAHEAAAAGDLAWGEAHTLTLDHPLASVPVLRALFGFGRRGIPRAGGPYTVSVADFSGSEPPLVVTHGPSQRHVVDLADPDGPGGFILPGGESGFPGDPHGMDQFPRWRRGELVPVPVDRGSAEARTVSRIRLRPG